jgi:hypothetical protein
VADIREERRLGVTRELELVDGRPHVERPLHHLRGEEIPLATERRDSLSAFDRARADRGEGNRELPPRVRGKRVVGSDADPESAPDPVADHDRRAGDAAQPMVLDPSRAAERAAGGRSPRQQIGDDRVVARGQGSVGEEIDELIAEAGMGTDLEAGPIRAGDDDAGEASTRRRLDRIAQGGRNGGLVVDARESDRDVEERIRGSALVLSGVDGVVRRTRRRTARAREAGSVVWHEPSATVVGSVPRPILRVAGPSAHHPDG